jgi:hypothetical protein
MCAEGKTLIDSYSHMLKRLQLLVTASPGIERTVFRDFDQKYAPIVQNILGIINSVFREARQKKLNENKQKLTILTKLDKKLKTLATGFYDVDLSAKEKKNFHEMLKNIFTPDRLELMEVAQAKWTKGGYVLDSKDQKLYPVEEYVFNVSKKREFYDSNKKLTPYRINVHNTRSIGGRSSTLRGERYLADGEYTEANRRMKEIGKGNKNIHADHIIPLALGGIHDAKNLRPLPGRENIYKKDKLTKEGFSLLLNDKSYLSRQHWRVFDKYKKDGLEVVQEALRNSVRQQTLSIIAMNEKNKIVHLRGVYPAYKKSQIERIIRKHFTNYDDQSTGHSAQ